MAHIIVIIIYSYHRRVVFCEKSVTVVVTSGLSLLLPTYDTNGDSTPHDYYRVYKYIYIPYLVTIIKSLEPRFSEHNAITFFKLGESIPSAMIEIDQKNIRPYT